MTEAATDVTNEAEPTPSDRMTRPELTQWCAETLTGLSRGDEKAVEDAPYVIGLLVRLVDALELRLREVGTAAAREPVVVLPLTAMPAAEVNE